MQIKTTMGYHLTPARIAITKKPTHNKRGRGYGKQVPFKLLVEM